MGIKNGRILLAVAGLLVAVAALVWWLGYGRVRPESARTQSGAGNGYLLTTAELRQLEDRARAGDAKAAFELAEHYSIGRPDYEKHRQWLTRAADSGHAAAGYTLGYELMREGNYREARSRLERALENATRTGDTQTASLARSVLDQVSAFESGGRR